MNLGYPTTLPRCHYSCALLLFSILSSIVSPSLSSSSSLSPHNPCASLVPQPETVGESLNFSSFPLRFGSFQAGERFLGLSPLPASSLSNILRPRMKFYTHHLSETDVEGVYQLAATVTFLVRGFYSLSPNASSSLALWNERHPEPSYDWQWSIYWNPLIQRGYLKFYHHGFWSRSDGKLCMAGSGYGFSNEGNFTLLHTVLKLSHANDSTILTSLVTGTFESLDSDSSYFDPVSVLGYNMNEHEHTLISEAKEMCYDDVADDKSKSLGLKSVETESICSILAWVDKGFELHFGDNCATRNCNPLGESLGFLPQIMHLNAMTCMNDGKIQLYLAFSNTSIYSSEAPFIPGVTFIGEGFWDWEKNRLCVVACQILNFIDSLMDSTVGDCTVGMSLRFPASLSIRNRATIVGRLWSSKSKEDPGYFDSISFEMWENMIVGIPGLNYEYIQTERLRRSCNSKATVGSSRKKSFRDPRRKLFRDMRFGLYLKDRLDSHGGIVSVYFKPVFIGDRFDENYLVGNSDESETALPKPSEHLLNLSYNIGFASAPDSKWSGILSDRWGDCRMHRDITAEGIYNAESGTICMVGCRKVHRRFLNVSGSNLLDCEVLIDVQFPVFDPQAEDEITATIRSTRNESDPLHFELLALSSLSSTVVAPNKESSSGVPERRKDQFKNKLIEIGTVLIFLMLLCVFTGSRLVYLKEHPGEQLPSKLLLMLLVFSLGHIIPLQLDFEALLFRNWEGSAVVVWLGGWFRVNAVLVYGISAVAFLLQFRFLQLTWPSRVAKKSWIASWMRWCLPRYLVGRLILLCLFHLIRSYVVPVPKQSSIIRSPRPLWEGLLPYSWLVLDGFLLPQAMVNVTRNFRGKALAIIVYTLATLLRTLPYAYDAYRAEEYLPHCRGQMSFSADQIGTLYSNPWNIIVPCGGLLFAAFVFLLLLKFEIAIR